MPFKRGQLVEMVENEGYEWIPKGTVGVYLQEDPEFDQPNTHNLCQVDWFLCFKPYEGSITSCFGHRLKPILDMRGEVVSVPV